MPEIKRLFLTEADVTGLLDMELALEALDDAFRARSISVSLKQNVRFWRKHDHHSMYG